MPDPISIQAKVRPILEAVEEYNLNSLENAILDEEESNYQLNLDMPNGNSVTLAKASLALFHSDRSLYNQEIRRIKEEYEKSILATENFQRNKSNFEDLISVSAHNKITPFIGAGVSMSAGLMSWRNYLSQQAKEAGFDENRIEEYLSAGKFEELLEEVANDENGGSFEFYFLQDFGNAVIEDSLAWVLPELFEGCVITTNFDKVLEDSYAKHGKHFNATCEGLGQPDSFIKSLTLGQRSLLKLHGSLETPSLRIFRQGEYQQAYSTDSSKKLTYDAPIPKLLRRIYRNHPLLFIGCSLEVDRTIHTFKDIVSTDNRSRLADHFAIVEAPEDERMLQERKNLLTSCNIKPIWYENGQHEKVGEILDLLKLRVK